DDEGLHLEEGGLRLRSAVVDLQRRGPTAAPPSSGTPIARPGPRRRPPLLPPGRLPPGSLLAIPIRIEAVAGPFKVIAPELHEGGQTVPRVVDSGVEVAPALQEGALEPGQCARREPHIAAQFHGAGARKDLELPIHVHLSPDPLLDPWDE